MKLTTRLIAVIAAGYKPALLIIGNGPNNGIVPNKKKRRVCFATLVLADKFVNGSND